MTAEIREKDYVSTDAVHSHVGDPIIQVRNLSVTYDAKNALNSVSTTISSNEIVAIMGRNGAGKSSLLKSLAGISDLSSGAVVVSGTNPQNKGRAFYTFCRSSRQKPEFMPRGTRP